jgi:hypothetical protein
LVEVALEVDTDHKVVAAQEELVAAAAVATVTQLITLPTLIDKIEHQNQQMAQQV